MTTLLNLAAQNITWQFTGNAQQELGIAAQLDTSVLLENIRTRYANGRKQASLELTLKANAIVDKLDLVVTATNAELVSANEAGDVRVAKDNPSAIVVDFGTMLTVNQVSLQEGFGIESIAPWLGTKFDPYSYIGPTGLRAGDEGPSFFNFSDLKTERLLINLSPGQNAANALDTLLLSLPDLPSGLSISINDDEPVWRHDPMVKVGTSAEVSDDEWNEEGKRVVSLASALTKYTQNSSSTDDVNLTIVLNSNVPGNLKLDIDSISQRHIHRLAFEGRDTLNLGYEFEGKQQLLITPPANLTQAVSGLQLTISGELTPTLALPAIASEGNEVTELLLGKGRAACVRLDGNIGLVELSGVRLPLQSGNSGAEASIVLWTEKMGIPSEVKEGGASDPVNWTGSALQWVRFNFREALALAENETLWAAIHVNRGEVTWKMATADQQNNYPVRIGSPAGPWRALPAIFGEATSLGNIAGRIHLLGNSNPTKPLPSVSVSLQTNTVENENTPKTLSPSSEPTRLSFTLPLDASETQESNLVLNIISHSEGSIEVSELDLITGEELS